MAWQSSSINPTVTSPAADISKITNDLAVLRSVLGGGSDGDVPFTPLLNQTAAGSNLFISGIGYVGIGTGTPATRLAVRDDSVTQQVLIFSNSTTGAAGSGLYNNTGQGVSSLVYASGYVGGSVFGVGANGSAIHANAAGPFALGTAGAQPLYLGTNGVERMRIDSSGGVFFPSVGTTASAANAFLNSGSSPVNQLLRSTSSRRYKQDIRDLPADKSEAIFDLRPVVYKSKADADDQGLDWYGLIAEEVAQVDPRLCHYIELDGQQVPDGVQYDRIAVLLLAEVKALRARVDALEAEARQ